MAEQRWRWCSQCDAERPAAEFVSVSARDRPSHILGRCLRCPSCGYVAAPPSFMPIDPPPRTEGGEG
jgi:hypothetical protein